MTEELERVSHPCHTSAPQDPSSHGLMLGHIGPSAILDYLADGIGSDGNTKVFRVPSAEDKLIITKKAVASMKELVKMVKVGAPIWIASPHDSTERLNEDEYHRTFDKGLEPKYQGLKCEASRGSAVVNMKQMKLVKTLMDVVSMPFH